MRRKRGRSSQNAPQPYERKRSVIITFRNSPFFGQESRILKVTLGRHVDLYLELPSGKRISMDASWTNYDDAGRPHSAIHRIDLLQIQPIVELLEYLNDKRNQQAKGHNAIPAE